LGLKLNQVSRDKLAGGKAGQRVYKFMPILTTDIRYQILQNWLKIDNEKMAKKTAEKMTEIIDTSSIELDPPKIIINTITDTGSDLAGSDVGCAIAPGPIAQPTFITRIIENMENAVNFVADIVISYLTPDEIAAGYF
jgi:hypothetical protein